jgi:hypothetical protein
MGMIEIAGTRLRAWAAAKAFRMLLVLWVERGCASRFSLSGLLRIVMCGGERDWRTEVRENVCASRFSLSGLLRMVMCGGGRDWSRPVLPGSIRMLLGLRGCASRFSFSGSLRMVMRRGEGDDRYTLWSEGRERIPDALRRMLLGFGVERGWASRFSLSRMVICGAERGWQTEARGDTGEGEDCWYIVDKGLRVTSSWMVGGTERAPVLAGLVRIVMDWLFEITRCSSGLLELFVPVVLGRLVSWARGVAVGWEADWPSIRALRRFSLRDT